MGLELMDCSLHHAIHLAQDSFTMAHVKHFAYELLKGVKYMHSAGVVHRDLKPGNVMVNKTLELKISDFGLAKV